MRQRFQNFCSIEERLRKLRDIAMPDRFSMEDLRTVYLTMFSGKVQETLS